MMAVHEQEGGDDATPLVMLVKGAPERVLAMCETAFLDGEERKLTEELRQQMQNTNDSLARRGERVLAFAHMKLPRDKYPAGFEFDVESEDPNFPVQNPSFSSLFLSLVGLVCGFKPLLVRFRLTRPS